MAAIEYALQHKGVVSTASYKPSGMPHIAGLCAALGTSAVPRTDVFGNKLVAL
jgi:hypothetical protein